MSYYQKGFFIEKAIGNNSFSYSRRKSIKKIYIPKLKKSNEIILKEGLKYGFVEVDEGVELGFKGLESFLEYKSPEGVSYYIFDNHNHAFYFIYEEVFTKKIKNRQKMIHFDQHKDTRIPDLWLKDVKDIDVISFLKDIDMDIPTTISPLDRAFYYTNGVLNVGNFISPLQEENIVSDLIIVDSTYSLSESQKFLDDKESFIVDIDLDFFSEDMDYINYEIKIDIIKKFLKKASIVTIASSPFFIDFKRAEKALYDILT
ncbi:hypothetical protein J2Z35_000050 [Acetoanaerobium pronyense]|uniref:Uncharacterized protein n=1 Tax=Acetoanaerobium pronyense TaxID=1482736 RepID=A0ABS4KER5_9FIRM|nr:UPF0489 family protein [Acetoanaerobium pronyense]MBP2026261.1 hypothetical protein [Acetoanaerobium pronyense]